MRYQRQMALPQIQEQGQQLLANSRVLCVGAGGLGCPALLYLAASGVGKIGIADADIVALSNLHRQVLFQEADVGYLKSTAAIQRLERLNGSIKYVDYPMVVKPHNVLSMISEYDYILDASDNITTKLLLNDACHTMGKHLITASVSEFSGYITSIKVQKSGCLRCLFSDIDNNAHLPTCEAQGVLGVVPGILGLMQALEVLKLVLKLQGNLLGKLYQLDILKNRSTIYQLSCSVDCVLCTKKQDFATLWLDQEEQTMHPHQISVSELKEMLKTPEAFFLLDVRNEDEHAAYNIGGKLIPLNVLPESLDQIPQDKPIVVYCRSGHRSQLALEFLKQRGFQNIKNLVGGVLAWSTLFGSVP